MKCTENEGEKDCQCSGFNADITDTINYYIYYSNGLQINLL